ncbi:MAG: DNA-processing protein DprA [Chloroflexi bacterium]|nr:DNA-processing protein DprA [Chloroflexota bacterium]
MTEQTPTTELVQWVALSLVPALGGKTIQRLLDHFETLDAVFAASEKDLRAVPRIGPKLAAAIRALDLDRTRADIARWQADGITILGPDALPSPLRTVDDAPPVLFCRGLDPLPDGRAAAIVGTRSPTPASSELAAALGEALVSHGWTVVSGLAAGIDTAAHQGALRGGGHTLAVLGSGVNVIYPPENTALASAITRQGALVAEVHPDTDPTSAALVARNRLISGLSTVVLVIETGTTGGSLHTVRFAHAQKRTVFACDNAAPGNRQLRTSGAGIIPICIDKMDAFVNELLK